ncbi:MAG: N-acetylmuramoyl-L-alanine amidase [Bacillota bacterium]
MRLILNIFVIAFVLLLALAGTCTADKNYNIYINEKEVTSRLSPVDENGTILVKARPLSEAIDAEINWINSINTLELKDDRALIKMMVGQPFMQIGDSTQKTEIGLVIEEGETYVPLFRIAEAFGFLSKIDREKNDIYLSEPEAIINKIKWSEDRQNIIIDMDEIAPYRIDSTENPNELVLEIENASLSENFIDEVSNKDFYVRFDKKEGDPALKVIITSNFPIPFKREGRILEDENNLILNLMPGIRTVEWDEEKGLNIEANGEIETPDISYLEDPRRMVIDIPSLRRSNIDLNGIKNNDYIKDLKISQYKHDPMILRIVFEIKDNKYLKLKSDTGKNQLLFEPVNRSRVLNLEGTNNRISFTSENKIEPEIFTLKKPPRLVIDLHNTNVEGGFSEELKINQDLVRKIRTSKFDDNKVRIVADLEKLSGYQWKREKQNGLFRHNIVLKNVLENINISDQNNYLDISFDLTGEIEYDINRKDSNKLVIDFENLDERINEEILPEATGSIKNIKRLSLDDSRERLIIELDQINNFDVTAHEPSNELNVTVSKKEIRKEDHIIVIDPGHGGFDPGAIGPSGLTEKEVNLDISRKVYEILSNSIENVILTRETDRFISLRRRVEIANEADASLFVSIHVNSSNKGYSQGTETFIAPEKAGKSLVLANKMQNNLINIIDLVDRGVKKDNFYVIKYTRMPAALVEVAFISNSREENLLSSNSFIENTAEAIAEGMLKYIEEED